jgi:N-acetylmuramoyl-L-alanine amidase
MPADCAGRLEINALYDAKTENVIRAFQRHFRPARVDGKADFSTVVTFRKLLAASARR